MPTPQPNKQGNFTILVGKATEYNFMYRSKSNPTLYGVLVITVSTSALQAESKGSIPLDSTNFLDKEKKNMFVYFVTGITCEDKETEYKGYRGRRCFGYFPTFEEAKDAVLNNRCDIFEYIHEYAVIEKVEDGIHQIDLNPTWYKWNVEKGDYEKTEEPDFAKGYVGWGIG